jgi:hypothetical protein
MELERERLLNNLATLRLHQQLLGGGGGGGGPIAPLLLPGMAARMMEAQSAAAAAAATSTAVTTTTSMRAGKKEENGSDIPSMTTSRSTGINGKHSKKKAFKTKSGASASTAAVAAATAAAATADTPTSRGVAKATMSESATAMSSSASTTDSASEGRETPLAPNFRPGQWQSRYQELVEFRKVHGHCLVPHNWVGNRPLAQVRRLLACFVFWTFESDSRTHPWRGWGRCSCGSTHRISHKHRLLCSIMMTGCFRLLYYSGSNVNDINSDSNPMGLIVH